MNLRKNKKSQQSGSAAAGLVGFITLLIVFYIIFLPPEYRAELLGESYPSATKGTKEGASNEVSKNIIFSENPGKIEYNSLDSYEYTAPSFSLFYSEEAGIIAKSGALIVKKGWFDQRKQNISFYVSDPEVLSEIQLALTLKSFSGNLRIKLNEKELFDFPVSSSNPEPIQINKMDLRKGSNNLEFSVSDVGLNFWKTNKYIFEEVVITAIEKDSSKSQSITSIYIPPNQGDKIEKAVLKFVPDCSLKDAGYLYIEINDMNLFSGIPDCGIMNSYTLPPNMLMIGKNRLSFKTDKGNYLIYQISLKTFLEEPIQPVYYFDLSSDLFKKETEKIKRCGEIDGYCPDNCDEDEDKDCCFKKYVNGYWCDMKTDLLDDRCVGFVDENNCGRCRSGYKDKSRKPPEACKGMCGDDTDGICPDCCNMLYDKDCCFQLTGEQYWCEDVPINGIDFRCLSSMREDFCKFCQTGYKGEKTNPVCRHDNSDYEDSINLRSGIDIFIDFKFTERGTTKKAIFYINGREHAFDTREDSYSKQINLDLEAGTNSIHLIPKSNLDIREIAIRVEE